MLLHELAKKIDIVRIDGNAEGIEITSVATITDANEHTISFIANPTYEHFISETNARAVIVGLEFVMPEKSGTTPRLLRCEDPYLAFAKASAILNPRISVFSERLDRTAVINPDAVIALTATIGAHTFIAHNVVVGEGTVIHPNCTIYDGVTIGANVVIGAGTVIGYDGFGFAKSSDGSYFKVPQTGGVVIEDDVEIGANCTIDRAAISNTIIRRGVKLDNLVHIAHNVEIGEDTVIAAQTGISGSTKIGKENQIAGQVGMIGHIHTVDGVTIIAQSGVSKSLTKPGVYQGAPAKEVRKAFRQEAALRMLPDLLERVRILEEKLRNAQK